MIEAMRSLPVPSSGANITRIEVWVVNTQANTQDVRNVIGFHGFGGTPRITYPPTLPVGRFAWHDPDLTITDARNPTNAQQRTLFGMMVSDNPDVLGFTGANGAIGSMGLGVDPRHPLRARGECPEARSYGVYV